MKEKFVCFGQIVRPRGLKGTCKVQLFITDFPSAQNLENVYIDERQVAVENSQIERDFAYLKLKGIDDIDSAEKLRGKKLYITRDKIVLSEGRYLVSELLGIEVFVGAVKIGKLCDVLQYGAADVYVVKGDIIENKKTVEVSFPALKKLIMSIDLELNKMLLDKKVFEEVAVYNE
ncbi:MAG TPA: ribosome maturation factor RimM [Clostridia bacterium]|nr:ribosome maturation factor RimM [Clostridia bacterium]